MSFFKQCVNADVENVFLNPQEFAEEVELDGVVCMAVRSERSALDPSNYAPEIPERTVVLHIRTDDIASDIDMGGSVMLDGKLCTVLSRHDIQGGMTRLELKRNGY